MPLTSSQLLDYSRPILVFGSNGQVGRALKLCLQDLEESVIFLGRNECDLTSESSIIEILGRYQPQVIINAAAYTAVDKAENEHDLVFAINAKAPKLMAQYIANRVNGKLVHYSTDYVFMDTKQEAYLETDSVGPFENLNVYGQSKLAGEQAIKEVFNLAYDHDLAGYANNFSKYYILRTSWVYGDGCNFIRSILSLAGECHQLKVVSDQLGTPTAAQWLADIGVLIAGSEVESGIYHAVPDGEASWHDLAVFAIEIAARFGEGIDIKSENILPILSIDYPLLAKRPYNSRLANQKLKKALSNTGCTSQYPHWQTQVEDFIKYHVISYLQR